MATTTPSVMSAVALIGEVDENPLIMDFDVLQERLRRVLLDLNQEHGETFAAPLAIPGGLPEFVGVIRDLGSAYPLTRTLAETLHPLSLRVAAVSGEIKLAADPPNPDQMDGAAFDAAGELLYLARKEDRLLLVRGEDALLDTMANALFLVLYRDMQNWTERQCEVVRLYRKYGRQSDVAEELEISQQSVSSSLSGAGWKVLAEAEDSLCRVYPQFIHEHGKKSVKK